MYKEKIINIQTNIETWRDYTLEEIAEVQKAQAESVAKKAQAKTKQDARNSALAKLAALGLTEDEIAAL